MSRTFSTKSSQIPKFQTLMLLHIPLPWGRIHCRQISHAISHKRWCNTRLNYNHYRQLLLWPPAVLVVRRLHPQLRASDRNQLNNNAIRQNTLENNKPNALSSIVIRYFIFQTARSLCAPGSCACVFRGLVWSCLKTTWCR